MRKILDDIAEAFRSNEVFTKRNAMYAAAAIAIVGSILGLTISSGFLWFTVVAQGYLLAFGTAADWR